MVNPNSMAANPNSRAAKLILNIQIQKSTSAIKSFITHREVWSKFGPWELRQFATLCLVVSGAELQDEATLATVGVKY